MKRIAFLFLALLVVWGTWTLWFPGEPDIEDGSKVTSMAIVTDRAMSDNMPYLGIQLPDGSGLCLWDPWENAIPDGIAIGDQVEVTYGKQDGFDRYVILKVTK